MPAKNLTVMFTDIKGFTARTAESSREGALRLVEEHERLLVPVFRHWDGRIVKTIGDAFLVTFESPTDGVLCGLTLQEVLRQYNAFAAEKDRINKLENAAGSETELAQAREELARVREEMGDLKKEKEEGYRRSRELKDLIKEIERALEDQKDEDTRQKLEEDLREAKRELDRHVRPPKPPLEDPFRRVAQLQEALEREKDSDRRAEIRRELEDLKRRMEGRHPPEDPPFRALREHAPDILAQIEELKREGRVEEAEALLREVREKLRPLPPGRESSPETRRIEEMEHKSLRLAEAARNAEGKERERLQGDLKAFLTELFDAKEGLRRREVEDLGRRLEELRAQLKRREENREAIIQKRLGELMGEKGEMDW